MKLIRFQHETSVLRGTLSGDIVLPEGTPDISSGLPLDEVTLLSPVLPSKVVSVGLNYRDHADELGMKAPEEPVLFIKPSTSVIGPGAPIVYPRSSERVDYEAELGVVIKDRVRGVSPADAAAHILGYTCVNDVTARDIQKKDVQWTRAKSFDTFAPVGPWIETELDPADLRVRAFLNGAVKQDSRTSELIFGVVELVSFISGVMTLLPGDIIATGTPSGIGAMLPGDEIAVEVEGIGTLKNTVISADERTDR